MGRRAVRTRARRGRPPGRGGIRRRFPAAATRRLTGDRTEAPGDETPGTSTTCTVMHVDLDAFFAAVEVLDDPTLAGRPVIVGGSGHAVWWRRAPTRRGPSASTFGHVRRSKLGVDAPMPCSCPGRYSRYAEMSVRFHEVLHDFTPVVEGIGLDEAFLDVAGARRTPRSSSDGRQRHPRGRSRDAAAECRGGRGPLKLLAKLASRAAKPTAAPEGPRPGPGVVVVLPGRGAGLPPPAARARPVGRGHRHREAARRSRRHDDGGAGRASPWTRCADRSASPTGTNWPRWRQRRGHPAGGGHPEVKSVGHEETFAVDHRTSTRAAPPCRADGRCRRDTVCAKRVWGKDGHGQGPLRGPRHHHPVPHRRGAARLTPGHRAPWPGLLLDAVDVSPGVRSSGCRSRASSAPRPRTANSRSPTGPRPGRAAAQGRGWPTGDAEAVVSGSLTAEPGHARWPGTRWRRRFGHPGPLRNRRWARQRSSGARGWPSRSGATPSGGRPPPRRRRRPGERPKGCDPLEEPGVTRSSPVDQGGNRRRGSHGAA